MVAAPAQVWNGWFTLTLLGWAFGRVILGQRGAGLAGAACMELVAGVAQLRPEDAMVEAMLRGWRAQQAARGLSGGCTAGPRELVVRRFLEFTNEYPWAWTAAHLDEWSVHLTAERHLAVSTVRGYQGDFKQTQDMAARRSFDETFKERQASQDLPRTCDEMIDWLWQWSFNCHAATRNLVRDIQALLVGEKSPLRCDSSEIPEMEW